MRHLGMLGLLLLLVVAVIATDAASASAVLPEFNTTFPTTFSATGNAVKFETASGSLKMKCKSGGGFDVIEGPTVLGHVGGLPLRGCSEGTNVCTALGATESGSVPLGTADVTLGYIDKATKRVGLKFKGNEFHGGELTAFECGIGKLIEVRGSVIGEWTALNAPIEPRGSKVKGAKGKLVFAEKKGHQSITSLEGEAPETLTVSINGGPEEETALKLSSKLGASHDPIELKG
jgi:hypothetical protein